MAQACRLVGGTLLSCLLWLAAPALLRSDSRLVYVTERGLRTCACARDPPACGAIGRTECDCKERPLSALRRTDVANLVKAKRLTVWYTSPPHVALLLNNSEVRHLLLVKCGSTGTETPTHFPSHDYFAVQRLERLTVSYPFLRGSHSHDYLLGVPYQEEARIGVIHSSVLTGKGAMKAYTVQTDTDSDGVLPFPKLSFSPVGLSGTSSMFVTFLY